jgi:hypothetical protein
MKRLLDDLRYGARHPWARGGLWACAATLAALCAALAAWWPEERAHAQLEDAVSAKRRMLVEGRRAEELARAYEEAKVRVGTLEAKLQHAATQAQLVQSFARLARRHGVRIVGETYEEGRGAGRQLGAELVLQASYPSLREFIAELATLPTWSEVHEVRIENAQGAAQQKARVRIVTYRQSVEARKGA